MSVNTWHDMFGTDLYRYYGKKHESIKQRLFRPRELKYILYFRKLSCCRSKLLRIYFRYKLWQISKKTHIQISAVTTIGEGFYIGHCGRLLISAVIGKNFNVATGVTIGQENRGKRKGIPVIGDNCWIGTNSVIVGNISIGNDVLIAPLSFVNFDVPDHSIVIGNPAKIIPKENATNGYIHRTV